MKTLGASPLIPYWIPTGRQLHLVAAGRVDPELHRIGKRRAMTAELAELLPPRQVLQLLHDRGRGTGRIGTGNRRRRSGDGG
jgi:hypothetical protein